MPGVVVRTCAGLGPSKLGPYIYYIYAGLGPCAGRHVPITQHRREHFVAVREDVRADIDRLAHGPFDRETSSVDFWLDVLDDDAARLSRARKRRMFVPINSGPGKFFGGPSKLGAYSGGSKLGPYCAIVSLGPSVTVD